MNLLIENLNSLITSEDLSHRLENLKGFVKSWIKHDRHGISEGVGYARFESLSDGRQAILKCNGMLMYGQKVKLAQVREIPHYRT